MSNKIYKGKGAGRAAAEGIDLISDHREEVEEEKSIYTTSRGGWWQAEIFP